MIMVIPHATMVDPHATMIDPHAILVDPHATMVKPYTIMVDPTLLWLNINIITEITTKTRRPPRELSTPMLLWSTFTLL